MRLRLIEAGDLEAVRTLRNTNREWFFDDREVTPEQHRAWFESLPAKSISFYVIEEDGEVIGTVSVSESDEGSELGNLTLDERYRGRGIMSRAIEDLCRAPGTYFARVKPENDASARVFQRAGFAVRHAHFERRSPA